MQRRAVGLALSLAPLVAGVLVPRDALACLCAPSGLVVSPGPLAPVPRDVRPLVTLDSGWAKEPICDDAGKCVETASHLELRPAATAFVAPTPVPVEVRVVAQAVATPGWTTVQLTPATPLPGRTRFEIVLVEAERRRPTQVVGTFRTGESHGGPGPAPPTLVSSTVVGAAPTKGLVLGCGPTAPVISLRLAPPPGEAPLRTLVWVAAGGSPDDALPARAALAFDPPPPTGAPHATLSLGELGCAGNAGDVPVAKDVHVRLRTLDAAGRRSAATEAIFDTRAKPK